MNKQYIRAEEFWCKVVVNSKDNNELQLNLVHYITVLKSTILLECKLVLERKDKENDKI